MRTQQVECIVYRKINDKIEYLLLKRIPGKGGFCQPPCGGVDESDNSLLGAAIREIREETGITEDKIMKTIEEVYKFTMNADYLTGEKTPPLTEYVFGFMVYADVEIKLENNIYVEHDEFIWADLNESLKLLKWEDNKEAFRSLDKLLNN